MKYKIIIAVITLSMSFSLSAQKTPEEMITKFFNIYNESPENAVDYIFGTNTWMSNKNQDGIDNVKYQLSKMINLIGDYYSYEKITEKSVGKNYKLISYMVKYDRQPIRFTFIFFRPDTIWQIQNFQYDDDLDEELEAAAKANLLKENTGN